MMTLLLTPCETPLLVLTPANDWVRATCVHRPISKDRYGALSWWKALNIISTIPAYHRVKDELRRYNDVSQK